MYVFDLLYALCRRVTCPVTSRIVYAVMLILRCGSVVDAAVHADTIVGLIFRLQLLSDADVGAVTIGDAG